MIYHVDFPSGCVGRYGGDGALMNAKVYNSFGGVQIDPRPGGDGAGYVWYIGNSHGEYLNFALPDVNQRFGFSCRIFQYVLPDELGRSTIFRLWEDTDQAAVDIQMNCDGSLGDGFFVAGSWQLLEVMLGAGAGFNHTQIRIDGELVLDEIATIPRPVLPATPVYFFKILNSGAPNYIAIKDFVLQGDTDAAFIGPANVRQLTPSLDLSSGWTRSTGASDFEILDNSPPGAAYIAAPDPIPAPSVTELAGLLSGTKSIGGLFPCLYMSSASGGSVQTSLVESGTPRDGDVFNPVALADYYSDNFPLDPATGLPWDPAVVAALQLSINRTV